MHASSKGALVAAAIVLAVAVGCGLMTRFKSGIDVEPRNLVYVIAVMCILPALVVGSALGEFLGDRRSSPFVRWLAVAFVGCCCTIAMGVFGQLPGAIAPTCILVAVGASVLEKWTRPFDHLPVARALRHGRKCRRRDER